MTQKNLYQCSGCGLHYENEEVAKQCAAFCKEHNGCSLEITTQSVERKSQYYKGMSKGAKALKSHVTGMIILLIVQYILGMLTNLYVQFPAGGTVGQNWEFMHGQWLVWAHLILGTLIVIGVVSLYIRALRLKDRTWKITGGIAAASVISAWVCGEEFISRQQSGYSFAMSVFFIIALVALGGGLYATKN